MGSSPEEESVLASGAVDPEDSGDGLAEDEAAEEVLDDAPEVDGLPPLPEEEVEDDELEEDAAFC